MCSIPSRLLCAFSLCGLLSFTSAVKISAAVVVYDPSLNTLPSAQGFTLTEDPPASPAPTVTGGILSQGPTSLTGDQFFHRNDFPFNLDDGFTLEVTVKVISSTYDPNAGGSGSQRSGWYMEGIDQLGRRFIIGFDSSGVTVNTDANLQVANSLLVRPFNTTDGFHNYRLVVAGGTGTLFIDNISRGSLPIGPVVDPATANRVFFGDGTAGGDSETRLSFLRYADRAISQRPPLSITRATNGVLVSWPATATNFVLEATSDLTPPTLWVGVTNSEQVDTQSISVVIQADKPRRFFRLRGF
jgi:hypothetical protein